MRVKVRFGSLADIKADSRGVLFVPIADIPPLKALWVNLPVTLLQRDSQPAQVGIGDQPDLLAGQP